MIVAVMQLWTITEFRRRVAEKISTVPEGVRMLGWTRATRWFGWGFGEPLLPLFILTFSQSLTEAGLLRSIYDIVFLATLPLAGMAADRFSGKHIIALGLLVYPFIGISYYLAGATGAVVFILLARGLNGFTYCLDCVGVDTYIRRVAPRNAIASSFGFMASLGQTGWLLAALIGAYAAQFVPIHVLLFLIVPFNMLAFIPFVRAPKDTPEPQLRPNTSLFVPLTTLLQEFAAMKKGLYGVVFLMFALSAASVGAGFFIPIAAYKEGASLAAVALLATVSTVPYLLEFWLAELIDGSIRKRRIALSICLLALPFLFIAAGSTSSFGVSILIALGIQTACAFGILALQSYATVLSRRDRYGELSSVLEGATTFGDLLAPVAIGIFADAIGLPITFACMAFCLAGIALYFRARPIE